MINPKYHCIWYTCTYENILSIILYKVYVNLCDIWGGHVTLRAKAAHLHSIRMIHAKYLCIWIWSTSLLEDF